MVLYLRKVRIGVTIYLILKWPLGKFNAKWFIKLLLLMMWYISSMFLYFILHCNSGYSPKIATLHTFLAYIMTSYDRIHDDESQCITIHMSTLRMETKNFVLKIKYQIICGERISKNFTIQKFCAIYIYIYT